MKRTFVYATAGLAAATAAREPPLKKYKSFEENDDDDDLLDAIGTQALEQFESNTSRLIANNVNAVDQCAGAKSSSLPSSSAHGGTFNQSNVMGHGQEDDKSDDSQLTLALKQGKLLEQKVELLQEEQYSLAGEIKILRGKLNQAEANSHTKEITLQQIHDQSKSEWVKTQKEFEDHIASLSSRLKFKEQEVLDTYEKCKYLEQQQHPKTVHKTSEVCLLGEEMKVQSDIKVTPVSARCKDAKNTQKKFRNFGTEFPVSDPLKAFSQDVIGSGCSKGKSKAQRMCSKAVNVTSTPIVRHSTPVIDQETQTPVVAQQHGRFQDGVTFVELHTPLMNSSGRKLFNHLMNIHPKNFTAVGTVKNENNTDVSKPVNILSLIHPVAQCNGSIWRSHQSSRNDRLPPINELTTTHERSEVQMEDVEEEDKAHYFLSLDLPTSSASSPFLRDPMVQLDLQQSLASLLGSSHMPIVYPGQNLLQHFDTFSMTDGDSGIKLLLVLEKLVGRYHIEKTKGQDNHCKSVESWVSGSLEGLLPSFASPSDEGQAGCLFRDPMRMDNAQAIVRIMEVLLELVRCSKPARCHILDTCLGIPSKPLLALESRCVSTMSSLEKGGKWIAPLDISGSGRDTPVDEEQADDGPAAMDCNHGLKLETPDTSLNSVSSYLKNLMLVPLAGKLGISQRTSWPLETTASMSKMVLVGSSSDTSILSSVIGSYNDHNTSVSTSFTQSNHSSSSIHPSCLFNTLLRLIEPSHRPYEEEAAVTANALEILVVLAQDCSEHQLECYLEPSLGATLRSILRRGRPRMRVTVVDLLYYLASSQTVLNSICSKSESCPLLQAYEQLTNPSKPFSNVDTEYGLKILQMVARSVSTGNKEGGKSMFIFDFDCCCSGELISGLLAFTKRLVKNCVADQRATSNISYEVVSQVMLVLLPVILNQDIGDDITHSDVYKHEYTEVVKGLSTVSQLLSASTCSGRWEQAVSTLKELLDYDDLQDCLNTTCTSATIKMSTD